MQTWATLEAVRVAKKLLRSSRGCVSATAVIHSASEWMNRKEEKRKGKQFASLLNSPWRRRSRLRR